VLKSSLLTTLGLLEDASVLYETWNSIRTDVVVSLDSCIYDMVKGVHAQTGCLCGGRQCQPRWLEIPSAHTLLYVLLNSFQIFQTKLLH
jgi:hypothetical protein